MQHCELVDKCHRLPNDVARRDRRRCRGLVVDGPARTAAVRGMATAAFHATPRGHASAGLRRRARLRCRFVVRADGIAQLRRGGAVAGMGAAMDRCVVGEFRADAQPLARLSAAAFASRRRLGRDRCAARLQCSRAFGRARVSAFGNRHLGSARRRVGNTRARAECARHAPGRAGDPYLAGRGAMSPWYIFYVWIAATIAMTIGWLVQLRTRNAGIVDAIWSFGMGASALYYAW